MTCVGENSCHSNFSGLSQDLSEGSRVARRKAGCLTMYCRWHHLYTRTEICSFLVNIFVSKMLPGCTTWHGKHAEGQINFGCTGHESVMRCRQWSINHHAEDQNLGQIQLSAAAKRASGSKKLGEPLSPWSFRISRHVFCPV